MLIQYLQHVSRSRPKLFLASVRPPVETQLHTCAALLGPTDRAARPVERAATDIEDCRRACGLVDGR